MKSTLTALCTPLTTPTSYIRKSAPLDLIYMAQPGYIWHQKPHPESFMVSGFLTTRCTRSVRRKVMQSGTQKHPTGCQLNLRVSPPRLQAPLKITRAPAPEQTKQVFLLKVPFVSAHLNSQLALQTRGRCLGPNRCRSFGSLIFSVSSLVTSIQLSPHQPLQNLSELLFIFLFFRHQRGCLHLFLQFCEDNLEEKRIGTSNFYFSRF